MTTRAATNSYFLFYFLLKGYKMSTIVTNGHHNVPILQSDALRIAYLL